ncbi:U-box domain-containing protein 26-like [Hibiscus syriacus]|uniref:ER membrane protein complex subunit 1 n=1 Tax=Hibiscus syriacus TaxID=106335 RepID=A0A6A2Z9M6_HIBSY|nr:U-box domain-containing protein 26-like [Hibiscus syriacus]
MAITYTIFIFLFFSSLHPILSLYEDQVGLTDWHHQYIGKVKQAVFHTHRTGRKRVVVSTEHNVIATLDLRHGEIFWRHVLGSNDVVDGMDIDIGKLMEVYGFLLQKNGCPLFPYVMGCHYSFIGSILRAWNLPDGQMVFSLLTGLKISLFKLDINYLLCSVIHGIDILQTNLIIERNNVVVIFSNGRLHAVSCIDGEVLWNKDFEAESLEVQREIQPPGSNFVYIVGFAAPSQFEMYQINARNGELLKHERTAFSGRFSGQVSLVSSETLVALDSRGVIGEGVLEVVEKENHETGIGDALSISEGQQAFALVQHAGSDIHLTFKLAHDWGGDLLKESIKMDQQWGLVQKWKGLVYWLPKLSSTCLNGLRVLASPEDIAAIQYMRLKSSEKSKMTRDHNGFRKLIIVSTRAGKLFALHTGDGRIVWSRLLQSLRKSEACQHPIGFNLCPWQVPHHHALDENPFVLVVGRCGPSSDALVEDDIGIIKGYALKSKCNGNVADKFCFDARELWSTIVLPSESEKIIATVTRKLNDAVHTQAKLIAADQDVIGIMVGVYLIDTVTGRVLHRMTHHGSQGSVEAVFSENWVVYHYFNLRAHRYEMSVIEIYDQSGADNKDVWKLLAGKHNLISPISSYSRSEGITSKQLLIGTIGDQVLALDKRFLDPRRSVNPTQAEREGIIPLTDSLPIIPQVIGQVSVRYWQVGSEVDKEQVNSSSSGLQSDLVQIGSHH